MCVRVRWCKDCGIPTNQRTDKAFLGVGCEFDIGDPVPCITTLYPLWAGTLVIALNHKVKFEKYFSSPAEPLLAYLVIYIFL